MLKLCFFVLYLLHMKDLDPARQACCFSS